jgi:hypothetical protein
MLDPLMQPLFGLVSGPVSLEMFLLRCVETKLGRNVHVYPSAVIYCVAPASPLVEARLSERGGHVEGRETVDDCH